MHRTEAPAYVGVLSWYNILMKEIQKILIVANWKTKIISLDSAKKLFVAEKAVGNKLRHVETLIAPPTMYLEPLSKLVTGHRVLLAAQDVFYEDVGAFMNETSPKMLKDRKITHSIVGHSDRRARGESNAIVAQKIRACLANNIVPIVCIGETERTADMGHLQFLKKQITESFAGLPKAALGKIVIAYEPVWSISTTPGAHEAMPEDCREMVLFIRKVLSDMFGLAKSDHIQFLYGGSADADNASGFLEHGLVGGLLVGSASVTAKSFSAVLAIAEIVGKTAVKHRA